MKLSEKHVFPGKSEAKSKIGKGVPIRYRSSPKGFACVYLLAMVENAHKPSITQ